MDVVVLINPTHPEGQLVDAASPHFSPLAQGIARGDGIFETMWYDGTRVKKVDEHLWRLRRSAGLTGMPVPDDDTWRRAVATAMAHWRPEDADGTLPGEAMVKLMVLRGYAPENPDGYAWVTVTPAPAAVRPTGPIRVALLERAFDSGTMGRAPWLLLGAKTLSYATNMAALREANARGAQDVLFTTCDGYVLEGPTSSVVVRQGRKLLTTDPDIGVLPGTTQRVLFRAAAEAGWETGLARLTPDDLRTSDGVWLTSSVRLMTPVAFLDDTPIAMDQAVTDELLALLLSTD